MNTSQFDLADRTAIVTGGGQGIGRVICLALAQAGSDVVVVDIDFDKAEAVAREAGELGRRSFAVQTDVCKRSQIETMTRQTLERFGKIDILVNNAGGAKHSVPVMEMGEREWDEVVGVNLKSVFLCSQSVAKHMIEQKNGNIVNIASISAFLAYPLCAPYGASKAGVINFTQTMAKVLGPHNIRVNAVAPGSISTESRTAYFALHPELEHFRPEMVPLGRLGTPEDVAWVVVFLASQASAYVNGQTITIDGGPR